jgi:GT2 family glycosyltransferase
VTSAPRVRVVVINFDGGDVTLRCLDSLRKTDYPSELMDVVVVDNASVDGLTWVIREQYPEVRLIESFTNEGFARGNNLALRDLAGVDLVALINNDTVPEPGWLPPLVDAATAADDVGAACPKMVLRAPALGVELASDVFHDPKRRRDQGVRVTGVRVDGEDAWTDVRFDERFWPALPGDAVEPGQRWTKGTASVWYPVHDVDDHPSRMSLLMAAERPKPVYLRTHGSRTEVKVDRTPTWIDIELDDEPFDIINNAGGALYKGWFGGDRGFLEPDFGQYDEAAEVFAWCGGAVLLRTDYLEAVGRFDPHFFLYYEDFDLSWRGRQLGWRYRYVPQSVIRHEHAYSSGEDSPFFRFWVDRNRRLTLVKNAPRRVAARAAGGAMYGALNDIARHTVDRRRVGRLPSPRSVMRRLRELASFSKAVPAMLVERWRIRRTAVVTDDEIAAWTLTK